MVTEEDLINTVAAAYGAGLASGQTSCAGCRPRPAKDVVQDRRSLARRVIETGHKGQRANDIRCTVSIGGFVLKAHTLPVGPQLSAEDTDARLHKLRDAIPLRPARRLLDRLPLPTASPGSSRACSRVVTGGSAASSRRSGATVAASTAGEHFSYERWMGARLASWHPSDRRRLVHHPWPRGRGPAWDHIDSGLDENGSGRTGSTPSTEVEVDDCRWTPCFDCSVCPQLGTGSRSAPPARPFYRSRSSAVRRCAADALPRVTLRIDRVGGPKASRPLTSLTSSRCAWRETRRVRGDAAAQSRPPGLVGQRRRPATSLAGAAYAGGMPWG